MTGGVSAWWLGVFGFMFAACQFVTFPTRLHMLGFLVCVGLTEYCAHQMRRTK